MAFMGNWKITMAFPSGMSCAIKPSGAADPTAFCLGCDLSVSKQRLLHMKDFRKQELR